MVVGGQVADALLVGGAHRQGVLLAVHVKGDLGGRLGQPVLLQGLLGEARVHHLGGGQALEGGDHVAEGGGAGLGGHRLGDQVAAGPGVVVYDLDGLREVGPAELHAVELVAQGLLGGGALLVPGLRHPVGHGVHLVVKVGEGAVVQLAGQVADVDLPVF